MWYPAYDSSAWLDGASTLFASAYPALALLVAVAIGSLIVMGARRMF